MARPEGGIDGGALADGFAPVAVHAVQFVTQADQLGGGITQDGEAEFDFVAQRRHPQGMGDGQRPVIDQQFVNQDRRWPGIGVIAAASKASTPCWVANHNRPSADLQASGWVEPRQEIPTSPSLFLKG